MIEVRLATPADLPVLSILFNSYRIFYGQRSAPTAALQFLTDRMNNGESTVFIAFLDNKPEGFVQLYPTFSSVGMKKCWILNDLFVNQAARKKGLAARLLSAAADLGRQTHARYLMLQTDEKNSTAQSLYEKNGWQKLTDFFYVLPVEAGEPVKTTGDA